ncbi:sugar transferase [Verrucomicrobiota bacterium sgz303538]
MIHRREMVALFHGIAQMGLALLTFWVFLDLQFEILGPEGIGSIRDYLICSLLSVAAFVLCLVRSGLKNENVLELDVFRSAQMTLRQVIYVSAPLFLYSVATNEHAISPVFLFSYMGGLGVVLYLSNRSLPALVAGLCFQGVRQQVSLVFGSSEDLTRSLSEVELNAVMNHCEDAESRLFVLHDFEEQTRPLSFIHDEELQFISLREEPLDRPFNRIIKRVSDVAIALPVIFFVLPWTNLLVWLIHRLQSPGPLFFRQPRTGLYNKEFCILKYRTMEVNHGRDAEQATPDDARIFPLGRWLRRLSIDELPQFINVLSGEMSIVGPRPHLFEHDALFAKVAQFYRVRTRIKPGITGLAQVRGYRGEIKTDEQARGRLESDLYYMENWSPMLDCLIIARTAWQMIWPPDSAY